MVLTELHERYFRLIGQGVSKSEACRMVGIDRKTGTRWRYGRKFRNTAGEAVHYPPVQPASPAPGRHPRYLSLDARTRIADLYREKRTVREIAAVVGRSPSTVSAPADRRYRPAGGGRAAAREAVDPGAGRP